MTNTQTATSNRTARRLIAVMAVALAVVTLVVVTGSFDTAAETSEQAWIKGSWGVPAYGGW